MRNDRSTRDENWQILELMVAVTGMLVIASAYGMARFGVGLFGPRLAAERAALAGVLDWAGTAQFTSYCVAAAVAIRFVDRRPRAVLLVAGATALLGCAGVALANDPAAYLAAVTVSGLSGGLASAALVPIIDGVVSPDRAATAQSIVNSGTATGLIAVGLIASLPVGTGSAWMVMALFGGAVAAACWRLSRNHTGERKLLREAPADPAPRSSRVTLVRPGVAAAIIGAGSALVWSFGPLLATESGAVDTAGSGTLWIAAGVGGLSAALTAKVAARAGIERAWLWLAVATAAATLALGVGLLTASGPVVVAAMIIFGSAYVSLSGVLILWARRAAPTAAGAATSVVFIALALGQAGGSALFGLLRGTVDPIAMIVLAACCCTAGGLVGRAFGRRQRQDVARSSASSRSRA